MQKVTRMPMQGYAKRTTAHVMYVAWALSGRETVHGVHIARSLFAATKATESGVITTLLHNNCLVGNSGILLCELRRKANTRLTGNRVYNTVL